MKAEAGMRCAERWGRRVAMLAAVLLIVVGWTVGANAAKVTYTLVVTPNPDPGNIVVAGNLGPVTFGSPNPPAVLTFTFEGDTADVFSWNATGPFHTATGFEIAVGSASVTVTDQATGTVLAKGNFLPTAGIFVSVDSTNQGIGFGSGAVLDQTNPAFPGEPVYPFSMISFGPISAYDLKSNFTAASNGWVISCVGFPVLICGTPKNLATDAGDLFLYQTPNLCCNPSAVFTAQVHALTTFAAFSAELEEEHGTFGLSGKFALGAGNNGISPPNEAVTLQIGNYSATIPAGSFVKTATGAYVYEGSAGGAALRIRIAPGATSGRYTLDVEGRGANLIGGGRRVTVGLTIGDDLGTTTVSTGSR